MGIKLADPKLLYRDFGEFYHYKDDIYWCFEKNQVSKNYTDRIGFYKKRQDGTIYKIKSYRVDWNNSDEDIPI